MKKLGILLLSIAILTSCAQEAPKDYAKVSGKLENNKDSLITISNRTGILKTIKINADGSFNDTLKVAKADIYTFQTSAAKRAPLYLKNGFDIQITGDAEVFMDGSYKNLDSILSVDAKNQSAQMVNFFQKAYAENLQNAPGTPSPAFTDYVAYKGGTKSLASFKGKYVYIDVWATWCGPCIQQIPYLKKLEDAYKNKNIEFVSISTDESRRNGGSWEAAEKKWRDFVKARQMGGVQLWSGKDFSFQKAYKINGIPRFILIDPKGNIVDANAPRPSEPRLTELFRSLGI